MFAVVLVAILSVLTVLAVIFALGYKPVTPEPDRFGRETDKPMPRSVPVVVAALLAALTLGVLGGNSFFKVDEGEAVVLRSFSGQVSDPITEPGFSAKAIWDKPIAYPTRSRNADFAGKDRGTKISDGNITTSRFSAETSDNASTFLNLNVRYRTEGTKAKEIYTEYGNSDALVEKVLLPSISSEIPKVVAQYEAAVFRQSRTEAAQKMFDALSTRLAADGIVIEAVDIRGVDFSEEVQASLDRIQQAKADVEAAQEQLRSTEIEAEATRINALADSDADQILRCGATTEEVTETVAGEERTVQRAVPVPDSECQNRLNEQVIAVREIEALREISKNGDLIVIGGENSLLNLPARSGSTTP